MVTKWRAPRRRDDGFTLVEVLVALGVIGTVLTAVTTFFVKSMIIIDLNGQRQASVQLASDGMEILRQSPGSTIDSDWLTGAGKSISLVRNGVTYTRSFTLTADPNLTAAVDITVKVAWSGKGCTNNACSYSASTVISTAKVEPIFTQAS